jgi:hypothetical protein
MTMTEKQKLEKIVANDLMQRGLKVVRPRAWAEGAIDAFTSKGLFEFSEDGGTGVIEIRFKDGHPFGVFVRRLKANEMEDKTNNIRGQIALWELDREDVASLLGYR